MKLSEAALIREITGEQPVALLDDVMSELDAGRQDYILNHMRVGRYLSPVASRLPYSVCVMEKRFPCIADLWKKQHK